MTEELIKNLEQVMQLLQVFGGWGVSVFLGLCLYFLYRSTQKTISEKDAIILDVIKETTVTIEMSRESNKQITELIVKQGQNTSKAEATLNDAAERIKKWLELAEKTIEKRK